MAIKPVIIFLILLCLIGVLWTSSATGGGKPERRRMPPHGWPTTPGSATVIAVWQPWPVIGTPAVCPVSRIPTCSRTTFRSHRSSRGASEWLFTGIITRPGTTSCSAKNKGLSAVHSTCSRMAKRTASSSSRRACPPYRRTRSLTISCSCRAATG